MRTSEHLRGPHSGLADRPYRLAGRVILTLRRLAGTAGISARRSACDGPQPDLSELQPQRPGGGGEPARPDREARARCLQGRRRASARAISGSCACRRRWTAAPASWCWWGATGSGAGSGPRPRWRSSATSAPTTTPSVCRSSPSCSATLPSVAPRLPAACSRPRAGTAVTRSPSACSIRSAIAPSVASDAALFDGCPFVGLDAFRIDQAHLFFGRQKETLDALACFDTRAGQPHRALAGDQRQQRLGQVLPDERRPAAAGRSGLAVAAHAHRASGSASAP